MKKNVLPILLLLVLCLTLVCSTALADGDCNHASVSTTGYCATCEHQFALKINKNGTDHYYDALDLTVYNNVLAGGTATLFQDVTYEYNSINVLEFEITSTIDLNGHSFNCQDQNRNDVRVKVRAGGNLTLCDSGTGEKGTFLPELYATSIEGSKGTVTLKGGVKVSKLFAEKDGVLNVEDAAVGTLNVSGSKCVVKLSGGTYDKIDGNPGSLLAEGHAYADKDSGAPVKLGSASTNLKVVSHTCSEEDGKNDTGKCDYCGAQRYIAKVDSKWYTYLETAFNNACDNTVTILADLTYEDNYSVPSTCTLDLNGHKVAGTVSLAGSESTISITIQGEQAGSELGTLNVGTDTAIVESGTVGTLKFSRQATFSGGSFGKLQRNDRQSTTSFADALASGCAYQYTAGDNAGKLVELSALTGNVTVLENVKVVACADHHYDPSSGKCVYCKTPCAHSDWDKDTGKCSGCEKQLYVAKIGNTGYDFAANALNSASVSDTVVLLADLDDVSYSNSGCHITLDLNGHNYNGSIDFDTIDASENPTLTLRDSKTGGKVKSISLNGGTINMYGGEVTTLNCNGTANLYGGSFGNISTRSMRASLAEGCAFQKTTGDKEMVKLSDIVNNKLENVAVVKCAHSSLTGGVCDSCGGLMYLDDKGSAAFYLGKDYSTIESDQSGAVTLSAGWYAVTKTATINGNLTFSGQVHLVLCDGATLTVNGMAITENNAASLTLYSQSTGENMGQLSVTGASSGDGGYIGINNNGSLTIHGGAVRTTGVNSGSYYASYGIFSSGTLTVNGGSLTATGGAAREGSYGIFSSGNVTVSGGTLTATAADTATESWGICFSAHTASTLTLSGGTVKSGTSDAVKLKAKQLKITGGSVTLARGSELGKLEIFAGGKLTDLLPTGCAYQTHNSAENKDEPVNVTDKTTVENVTIVTCTHKYENGACLYCLSPRPSSSGGNGSGGSSSASTTVKNDDGSTTTTVTDKKTGTVTATTQYPDGTVSETITEKDGTVTENTSTPDGTATETVTKPDGTTSETVVYPTGSVISTTTDPQTGTVTRVSTPENTSVTVTLPVETPTPGTVIIAVSADGTETVLANSRVTENGVEATLSGEYELKVVDNASTYEDVKAEDYFADAVAWASARGITSGTSEATFSPTLECSRSQLVTLLWRYAGSPTAQGSADFADVKDSEDFYTQAVAWAVENGLVNGLGNGLFGPEDPITREEMATILYRFVQARGGGFTGAWAFRLDFADIDQIADWSWEAVCWCVKEGILQGFDGNLMPNAECDRGQIVTMLYRLLGQ